MAKTSDSDEFRNQMEVIRKRRVTTNMNASKGFSGDQDSLQKVSEIVKSAVDDFVKEDRSLLLQSNDLANFFISYGFNYVCRIWISSATAKSTEILMQGQSASRLYSGEIQEKAIEKAIKNALLQWYSSLF